MSEALCTDVTSDSCGASDGTCSAGGPKCSAKPPRVSHTDEAVTFWGSVSKASASPKHVASKVQLQDLVPHPVRCGPCCRGFSAAAVVSVLQQRGFLPGFVRGCCYSLQSKCRHCLARQVVLPVSGALLTIFVAATPPEFHLNTTGLCVCLSVCVCVCVWQWWGRLAIAVGFLPRLPKVRLVEVYLLPKQPGISRPCV